MVIPFRRGFYGGLIIALGAGLYLIWLWQPERQVRRHTDNFFQAIEHLGHGTGRGQLFFVITLFSQGL